MGGLKDKMKWTYRTMAIGCFSLAGIPAFSGWWSKDEILTAASRYAPNTVASGPLGWISVSYPTLAWAVFSLGLITAGLTGFYTFRMFFMTFHGQPRFDQEHVHVHESPAPMVGVLVVLAVGALLTGLVGAAFVHAFEHQVVPEELESVVTAVPTLYDGIEYATPALIASTLIGLSGVLLAYITYARGWFNPSTVVGVERPDRPGKRVGGTAVGRGIFRFFEAKWGMDVLYLQFAKLGDAGVAAFSDFLDRRVVDRMTYVLGGTALGGSEALKRVADGVLRNYTAWIVGGIAVLLVLMKFVAPAVAGGIP
jgi:NADH-quinone oxidoreductase subunit L